MSDKIKEENLPDDLAELKIKTKTILGWIGSTLLDNVFLAIWLLFQMGMSQIISAANMSGIDEWLLITFQVIFAISTLIPVLLHIWADIVLMYTRYREMVRYRKIAIETSYQNQITLLQSRLVKANEDDPLEPKLAQQKQGDADDT